MHPPDGALHRRCMVTRDSGASQRRASSPSQGRAHRYSNDGSRDMSSTRRSTAHGRRRRPRHQQAPRIVRTHPVPLAPRLLLAAARPIVDRLALVGIGRGIVSECCGTLWASLRVLRRIVRDARRVAQRNGRLGEVAQVRGLRLDLLHGGAAPMDGFVLLFCFGLALLCFALLSVHGCAGERGNGPAKKSWHAPSEVQPALLLPPSLGGHVTYRLASLDVTGLSCHPQPRYFPPRFRGLKMPGEVVQAE